MNQSFYVRQGVSFLDMTAAQRDLAFALLRAALSARGLKQTRDIMRPNETLAELTGGFYGSEPVRAESGKYKGTVVMQEEQNHGLALVNALDEPRRTLAILSFAKESDNNLTEAWKDNVRLDYAGIRATELSNAQRTQLVDLIALYAGNMDDGHATVKMADVRAQLDRTYFAWIGPPTRTVCSTTASTAP